MIPELRREFNAKFTEEKYREFLHRLDEGCGTAVPFRNSETPCFFPAELLNQMATYGRELIAQLMGDPAYLAAATATIPAAYRVPNEDPVPLFVQVDFGLDHNLQPKLVEIQGFPSLYAYQPFLAETYREVYGLDPALKSLLGGLDAASYRQLLRRAIVGDHAPENVVLLEIHPQEQKTLCDFLLTERLCGVKTVCLTEVEKWGNQLYYRHEGKQIPIERIYNRVIVDELVRKEIVPPFDYRDELEVEWAGHPNWYYKISKFSLPYLDHPCVPRTRFLDQIAELPPDLENYVLKPLYSFAGHGVRVGPTRAEVEAVADPSQMILQERVDFIPTIETPDGLTKTELRIMYLWLDEPLPVTVLVRTGRGKMMGVDQNRDLRWVGASAAFTPG
jgi:hypothetical protein